MKDVAEKTVSKYYDGIEGIRAFSAIGIIMMHVASRDNSRYEIKGVLFERIIPFFTNFVFLFMIISAFGICCGYYEKISKGEITPQEFYQKRYQKILPFFATLVFLDLLIAPSGNALIEAFADVTLLFGLIPNANISVIGVGWFLGTVFVFYLVFPFGCFLMSNSQRACFSFIITIIYNIVCVEYFTQTERTDFIYSAMFFMAGCMIYLYREGLSEFAFKYRWCLYIFIAVITVCYFICEKNTALNNLWMLIMFSGILIAAIGSDSRFLNNRITRFVSSISMEIYLCHMVVFRVVEKLHLNYLFGTGWVSYFVTVVIVVTGAIIFSLCIKTFIEFVGKKMKKDR